jgi:hypothetical protein
MFKKALLYAALFILGMPPGGRCEEEEFVFNSNGFSLNEFDDYSPKPLPRENGNLKFSNSGGFIEWSNLLPPALYGVTINRKQMNSPGQVPMTLNLNGVLVATFDEDKGTGSYKDEYHEIEIMNQASNTFTLIVPSKGPRLHSIKMTSVSAVASLDDSWYFVRTGVETTFDSTMDSEMTISYETHKELVDMLKSGGTARLEYTIYAWDCEDRANNVDVTFPGLDSIITTETASNTQSLDVRQLYLDFEEENFYTSNVWEGLDTEGDIKICVKVELFSTTVEAYSMVMVTTQISQHVIMEGGFASMEAIDAAEVRTREFDSMVDVTLDVEICMCEDNPPYLCIDPQPEAHANSIMAFRIWSASPVAEIVSVMSFMMEQKNKDGSTFSYDGIDANGDARDDITEVEHVIDIRDGNHEVVRQHVFSRLFGEVNPNDIIIHGWVQMRLRRNRRLLRARSVQNWQDTLEDDTRTGEFEKIVELDDGSGGAIAPSMLVSAVLCFISLFVAV